MLDPDWESWACNHAFGGAAVGRTLGRHDTAYRTQDNLILTEIKDAMLQVINL
jgi:hypothetical protein